PGAPRPARGSLCPCTPLFRSRRDDDEIAFFAEGDMTGSGFSPWLENGAVHWSPRDPLQPRWPDEFARRCGEHHIDLGSLLHQLRSEEHTSELQSRENLVCRLL